jgi:hypothetical protein
VLIVEHGKVPISVLLVHGTWARGIFFRSGKVSPKQWFAPNSAFSQRLREAIRGVGFESNIKSFGWSGSNAFIARGDAPSKLVEQLQSEGKETRDLHQLVVAHSHGGNIAMRALHILHQSEELQPDYKSRIHVVAETLH